MFMISSKKAKEIKEYAINSLNTGVTIFTTTGGYMFVKRKMLMIVVPTRLYNAFKEKILEIDNEAFIVVSDCYEVTGGQRRSNHLFF